MDVVNYEIDGRKYFQTYLTIDETIGLSEIFEKINAAEFGNLKPLAILKLLVDKGLLERFFNVVLKGQTEGVTTDKIPVAVGVRIIKDFLSLNNVSEIIGTLLEIAQEVTGNDQFSSLMTTKK